MKELSIEEKAKAYDEALERARQFSEHPHSGNIVEYIFPELKESEDERIRKALLEYFGEECDTATINGIYCYKICEWLEKQSGKKSVYVITRSEEHADYVEAAFLSESKAKEYCKPFNEDENSYGRNITQIKIQ